MHAGASRRLLRGAVCAAGPSSRPLAARAFASSSGPRTEAARLARQHGNARASEEADAGRKGGDQDVDSVSEVRKPSGKGKGKEAAAPLPGRPLPQVSHAGGGGPGFPVPPPPIEATPSPLGDPDLPNEAWAKVVNPRTLVQHLDSYVIGQTKAKKVLSVAVFNHYLRARQRMQRERWEDAQIEKAMLERYEAARREHEAKWERERAAKAAAAEAAEAAVKKSRSSTRAASERFAGVPDVPAGSSAKERQDLAAAAAKAHQEVLTDYIGQASGVRRGPDGFPIVHEANDADNHFFSAHRPISLRPSIVDNARIANPRPSRSEADARAEAINPARPEEMHDKDAEPQTLEKSNVLLIGPTGSGKTLMMKSLAESLHVPFVHIDATPLTQAGYVGEDVDVIGQRLLAAADWDVARAQNGIVCIDEIDKLARRQGDSASKDVSGEGVQQALLRILEGTIISVKGARASGQADGAAAHTSALGPWWPPHQRAEAAAGTSGESSLTKRKAAAAGSSGGGSATYHLDTSNILFVLSGAFVGLDDVVLGRLGRAAGSSDGWSHVRDELQPQDLHKYGLIPEFVGRLPIIASLSELSEDELVRVLTEPKNALVAQYEALFSGSDVTLKVTRPALRSIARQAATKGTGARGLRRILEDRLLNAMYSSPGSSIRYALLDEQAADGREDVHLFGRGGRHQFWSLYDDEQDGGAGIGMGIQVAKTLQNEAAASDTTARRIRRSLRYRMLRPSRIGNLRIHAM